MKTTKMSIAEYVKQVSGYTEKLDFADRIAVDSEHDSTAGTTVFEFEDGSMLKFNPEDHSIKSV